VSDFSVLRPKSIYTGALVVICLILAYSVPTLAVSTSRRLDRMLRAIATEVQRLTGTKRTRSLARSILSHTLSYSSVLIVPMLLFLLFRMGASLESQSRLALIAIGVSAVGLAAGFVIRFAWSKVNEAISSAKSIRTSLEGDEFASIPIFGTLRSMYSYRTIYGYSVATLALIVLYVLALYMALFMIFAYPRIPSQFGGGRPEEVQLIIEGDKTASIKQLGIPIPVGSTITEPVQLLYQGSEVYILRLRDQRVVQIDKRLAPGLIIDQHKD
jgi:hypothetical protein